MGDDKMYKNIIEKLRCPKCKSELKLVEEKNTENDDVVEGMVCCINNHIWNIREGILDFQCDEHETDQWSRYYEIMDYEEVDEKLASENPENLRELYDKAHKKIADDINKSDSKVILDIATGLGTLLKQIVKQSERDIEIICVDLSFMALKYDRLKIKNINKRLNKNIKVNFIAADASNLPIKDNSIDMAVSNYGIANMIGCIKEGINEAYRVLNERGKLENIFIVMKKGTEGFNRLQNIREVYPNREENLGCIEFWVDIYGESYFKINEFNLIGESVGASEQDYVPYYNEWFGEYITVSNK